jgi:hypothetical protein
MKKILILDDNAYNYIKLLTIRAFNNYLERKLLEKSMNIILRCVAKAKARKRKIRIPIDEVPKKFWVAILANISTVDVGENGFHKWIPLLKNLKVLGEKRGDVPISMNINEFLVFLEAFENLVKGRRLEYKEVEDIILSILFSFDFQKEKIYFFREEFLLLIFAFINDEGLQIKIIDTLYSIKLRSLLEKFLRRRDDEEETGKTNETNTRNNSRNHSGNTARTNSPN